MPTLTRATILQPVLPATEFPLWVPLLTHYRQERNRLVIDTARMQRHAAQVRRSIGLWMLAGTTGDGWDLSEAQFDTLLQLSQSRGFRQWQARTLIGVLRPTTAEVIARIDRLRQLLGLTVMTPLEETLPAVAAHGLVGITVCPPVGTTITQADIRAHYMRVCDAARMPVVVYQLPQITGNSIAPETLSHLVAERAEIILFKDSSGSDIIAQHGLPDVGLLRGAEGDYASMLKSFGGGYDGFLLSTGNTLGPQLRTLIEHVQAGRREEALAVSASLTALVHTLFSAVQETTSGNPFSNTNRAIDHLLAYGQAWRQYPLPLLVSGARLPEEAVARVAGILGEAGLLPEAGYLAATVTA
ncbi:MAG: dihydrodipicolinate synthase family protein [Candidatus Competibacteraceae bacterium]